ncbi:MAG: LysM peptidoglycan-binding domain-containing protein, partial [Campylobacter sp.]|nr:LysM peptidoglycan-binding domain-containing protein [Campylobacter sp.]
ESKFLDNKATMTSNIYRCSNKVTGFEFSFDKSAHTATIQTGNQTTKEQAIEKVFQMKEIQTLTIDNQTYNIKNLSNLELRNAIENIPQVSFLLSTITIYYNRDILDIGNNGNGLYEVKKGDTLSEIAQKFNMTTKDLVKLNPWLCDEGRIKFNQNKVLIEGDPLNLSNTNHTLYGETNAENLLIDANGGDNIFIGGYKKDIMQSKAKGYDKYFTNANDEITDYDGKGEVWYNSNQLLSATKDNNKNDKYFYDNNGGYYEITNKGLKYTDINGETLIINSPSVKTSSSNSNSNAKLKYETLGIKLYEIDKDDGNGDTPEELQFTTLNIIGDRAIEGNDINFIITLSRALEKDLVLNLTTRDDDAIGEKDYTSTNTTITIKAGTTKYTYSIPTIKDDEIEKVEHFFLDGKVVNLSDFTDENGKVYINENATGMGVIVDKDSVNLTISNPSVNEKDGKAVFDISLSKPLDEDLDLVVSTHNKTATSPMDFTKNNKTITIKAGQTLYSYEVEITDDDISENTETFELVVKNNKNKFANLNLLVA